MINVALVGNPNTGKTTLFNSLTSSHEHVGNWHGVTVEEKAKKYRFNNEEIKLVDLPGVYSLTALSYEESVTEKFLIENKSDVVVNICDASNLKRNLYLTLSLLELGLPIIIVINQIDKRPICKIDFVKLEKLLQTPIVYVNANDKKSCQKVNEEIIKLAKNDKFIVKNSRKLPYLTNINLKEGFKYSDNSDNRDFYAIKLLEDDDYIKGKFKVEKTFNQIEQIAESRYRYIDQITDDCCTKNERVYGKSRLDKILLNRFLAFPIFLLLISVAFYLTFFSVGAWLSDGLNFVLDKLIGTPTCNLLIKTFGDASWIVSLFEVAILGGVGSVLSFLPQVALLFFFLSLLEDSGYLSRVAFVFEDILGKVGLSGKSVYTLLMGFGCSTSAVLTARNMEDKNSKIKTGLLTPYMSCSAKFPIYSVLGGAFFGASNILVIIGLYFLGVAVAILMSLIFEKTCLKSKEQSFILEFPPYRMMSAKRTFSLLWQNVKLFLIRVASLIVAMNIIIWLLSNFTFTFSYIGASGGVSMLETFGRILSPIFAPLGFNSWGLVSALIAGLVAKEVIVSSIALFNGVEENALGAIANSIKDASSPVFFAGGANVLSYLVFCLLYFPCLATASVLSKEIGKKWTFIGIVVELIVAYIVSFIVYRLALAFQTFGTLKVLISILSLLIIFFSIIFVVKKLKTHKICGRCKGCNKSCKMKK